MSATKQKQVEKPVDAGFYDTAMLASMAARVGADGFVPAEDLKKDFGPEKFTCGIAVLYRNYRVIREVRRPWKGGTDILGYEWADRRFSKAAIAKIPEKLGFLVELSATGKPKYGDYAVVTLDCAWTNCVVAGLPAKSESGDDRRKFVRDHKQAVLIPAYCLRAMGKKALPLLGREMTIAHRIGWQPIRIVKPTIEIRQFPVISDDGREQGKGLTEAEVMIPRQAFTLNAMVPTSVLSVGDFVRLIDLAGKYVRLSPGKSSGFGDFEVLGAK